MIIGKQEVKKNNVINIQIKSLYDKTQKSKSITVHDVTVDTLNNAIINCVKELKKEVQK